MKKTYLISSILLLSVLLSGSARAEDENIITPAPTTTSASVVRIEQIKKTLDTIQQNVFLQRQNMEALRASATAALELKKELIQNALLQEKEISKTLIASTTEAFKEQKEALQAKLMQEKQNLASSTAALKELKQEFKDEIEKRVGKNLDEKRTAIANGFEQAIKQLDDLASKVETRIGKMESAGADVSSARTALNAAREKIVLANEGITALENKLAETISTSTRKTMVSDIKKLGEDIKSNMKAAHRSITDAINAMHSVEKQKNNEQVESSTTSTMGM
ncbi:MAG: hypothetical protein WCX27_00055 [Candidatus Paceibacterota bacterium]|jgi:chromosome segregation ATPase